MATEVTKLITVSLGKIQQSRQAKNGLNLRKSLLVASVLHKARDIYVLDLKHRKIEGSELEEQQVTKKAKFQSQRSVVDSPQTVCDNVEPNDDCEDHAYDAPTQQSDQSDMCDDILDQISSDSECKSTDKENNPPPITSVRLESLSCRPCLKRQLSNDNSTHSKDISSEPEIRHVPRKRQRVDASTCNSAADSPQINNLVQIFNSTSFSVEPTDDSSTTTCAAHSKELNAFSLGCGTIVLTA